jgi:endonuclease-3 related protein
MAATNQLLQQMFDLLSARFGAQHWWPAENTLEILVGTVLAQNTNWQNVEKAIANLKRKDLLSLTALRDLPDEKLAQEIRSAGYLNVKTKRLKNLARFILERFQGDLDRLKEVRTGTLREELLAVKGIGPETADSILLYACAKPVFVADAYTYRILQRHGLADESMTYDELQAFFMDHLPADAALFNEFHALTVRLGREYCRKQPLCDQCPLREWGTMNFTAKDAK